MGKVDKSATETANEAKEEPPDVSGSSSEEPPGCTLKRNRYQFFGDVSDDQWNDWKWQFKNRITSIDQLARFIPLSNTDRARLSLVTERYPISITPYYFCLINQADPHDPVSRQAFPSFDEIALSFVGREDPLAEEADSVLPGLVHRYPDRVLMVLTDICPMLCRHCTRKREWRHGGWVRTLDQTERMLDYIRRNPSIRDVILSGGDPLCLSNSRIEQVLAKLSSIPHVEIVRIGTRFPVVLPQRIDDELCDILSRYGPIWLNTHFNHPNEITPEAAKACDKLLRSGVPVNNQSVLLRGVNDSVAIQTQLCHRLLRSKVRPYYLFQADEVQGTEHLRTSIQTGIDIIEGMRGHTSGLALPTYVVDLPDGGGKVPLQPNYVVAQSEQEVILRNYKGLTYRCQNPSHAGSDGNLPESVGRNLMEHASTSLVDLVA